jgi:hypothetical protein
MHALGILYFAWLLFIVFAPIIIVIAGAIYMLSGAVKQEVRHITQG